jgi:ankyrin repeat protein
LPYGEKKSTIQPVKYWEVIAHNRLREALVEGNQSVVESLFDEGFSVNDRLQVDWTPLHIVAKAGQVAMARWLISKGAELNAETQGWQTPLDLALSTQNNQMAALLRQHGGKRCVELSLHAAVYHRDMPSAKKHLESGTNPNLIRNGQLAICVALRRRRFFEAKFLLRKHVSVTDAEQDGETALNAALWNRADLEILKQIVALGADVNKPGAQRWEGSGPYWTPVQIAVSNENKQALEFLIAHGAKLPTEEAGEHSLVQIALDRSYYRSPCSKRELALWLIDQGASATIHQAAEAGHALQVQEHLRRGVDVNTPGTFHQTPLFLAVMSGHLDIAKLLLHSGADPNIADEVFSPDGRDTALHKAVEAEAADLVRLLMTHGADPHAKNASGESPRQLAERRNFPHLLRLMEVPVTARLAMDDPKQCRHLSQLPPLPLEDELVKRRKTGWKKRRRAKHPPIRVTEGRHPRLGQFEFQSQDDSYLVKFRIGPKGKSRSATLCDICDREELADDRLRLGWLIADMYELDGLHLLDAIPGPDIAMRESAPLFKAAWEWRRWAIG